MLARDGQPGAQGRERGPPACCAPLPALRWPSAWGAPMAIPMGQILLCRLSADLVCRLKQKKTRSGLKACLPNWKD